MIPQHQFYVIVGLIATSFGDAMNHTESHISHISVERLQSHLRRVLEREVIAAPAFTVFLNPNSASVYFNRC
jgi:hypothetical protein